MLTGYEIELVEREGQTPSKQDDTTSAQDKVADVNALKSLFGE